MTKELFSFLHCASSYVSSKNFGQSRQSYIGCTCLTFLHCVFSNVSSNCLPEKRQSHTGCICSTFLHCAFSNVSSNCLHEKMHSHTGCIWLTFLHCVLTNVFSKCRPEKMQSYIGCICLVFLHCAFSNVSSNGLLERMHGRIGCICAACLSNLNFHHLLQCSPSFDIWTNWKKISRLHNILETLDKSESKHGKFVKKILFWWFFASLVSAREIWDWARCLPHPGTKSEQYLFIFLTASLS